MDWLCQRSKGKIWQYFSAKHDVVAAYFFRVLDPIAGGEKFRHRLHRDVRAAKVWPPAASIRFDGEALRHTFALRQPLGNPRGNYIVMDDWGTAIPSRANSFRSIPVEIGIVYFHSII